MTRPVCARDTGLCVGDTFAVWVRRVRRVYVVCTSCTSWVRRVRRVRRARVYVVYVGTSCTCVNTYACVECYTSP